MGLQGTARFRAGGDSDVGLALSWHEQIEVALRRAVQRRAARRRLEGGLDLILGRGRVSTRREYPRLLVGSI